MKIKSVINEILLTSLMLTILFLGAVTKSMTQSPQNNAIPRVLKVLVIEQDPFLKTKDNIRASVFLKQDKDLVVNDLIDDLEFSSHGNIDINIVKREHFNEFPTFISPIPLKNGKTLLSTIETFGITILVRISHSDGSQ